MDLIEVFNESAVFGKLSLLVGFAPLVVALLYVVRPLERTLAFMRPVSLSAVFAGLCGLIRQPLMNMAGPMTSELVLNYVGKKNREITSALTSAI